MPGIAVGRKAGDYAETRRPNVCHAAGCCVDCNKLGIVLIAKVSSEQGSCVPSNPFPKDQNWVPLQSLWQSKPVTCPDERQTPDGTQCNTLGWRHATLLRELSGKPLGATASDFCPPMARKPLQTQNFTSYKRRYPPMASTIEMSFVTTRRHHVLSSQFSVHSPQFSLPCSPTSGITATISGPTHKQGNSR